MLAAKAAVLVLGLGGAIAFGVLRSEMFTPAAAAEPMHVRPPPPSIVHDACAGYRAENDWFVIQNDDGECHNNPGPGALIATLRESREPYRTEDVTECGHVVETMLVMVQQGAGIRYYRGANRCAAAVLSKAHNDQAELNRYR